MKRNILALVASLAFIATVPAAAQVERANPQNDGASFGVQHATSIGSAASSASAQDNALLKAAKAKSAASAAQKARIDAENARIKQQHLIRTSPAPTHSFVTIKETPRVLAYNIVTLTVHHTNGTVEVRRMHNARVNAGATAIANLIGATAGTPFIYVALSSDATAVAAGDTTCPSEYTTNGLARKISAFGGYTAPGSLGGSASYTLTASWTSTANAQAINKICALNASSSGTLGFETILGSTVTLNNGDTGNLTWTFNI